MKRYAILIGNTDGLPGTLKDLVDFKSYLRTPRGGLWQQSEISAYILNPSKDELLKYIDKWKFAQYDFVIVVFSGHGGYRNGTLFELNDKEETIEDSDLKGIAKRQINIFDCCRVIITPQERICESVMFSCSEFEGLKKKYNERIMSVPEQQTSLYACSIGECAYANNDGSYYIQNLIKSLKQIDTEYITAIQAHGVASALTTSIVFLEENKMQRPNATYSKMMKSQQLILGINLDLLD